MKRSAFVLTAAIIAAPIAAQAQSKMMSMSDVDRLAGYAHVAYLACEQNPDRSGCRASFQVIKTWASTTRQVIIAGNKKLCDENSPQCHKGEMEKIPLTWDQDFFLGSGFERFETSRRKFFPLE